MIKCSLPHIRWAWLIPVASATGLLLILNRCEQNPIIATLPGSPWAFSDTFFTVVDTILVRTPEHGGSLTLYAGQVDEQDRESGILIKFNSVDTSRFSDLQKAELVLFHRTFANESPGREANFTLYVVETPGGESDTIWAESDTGLTLAEFVDTTFHSTAHLMTDTVAVFVSGVASDSVLEHLAFPVRSEQLRWWAEGSLPNNGFLIRRENQGTLVGFHSSNSYDLSPYLALTVADTTSTGKDTTRTLYQWPTGDLSIYSSLPDNSIYSDGLLHLDHSSGIRSHIKFGPDFQIDTTSIIAGARLTLYRNRAVDVPPIVADRMDIQVLRRAQPLADERDSSVVVFNKLTYSKESDSLVLKLGSFLRALANAETDTTFKYYGLDLVVIPSNHDFDHFAFWGSAADPELKPRLEVTYSRLYKEVP